MTMRLIGTPKILSPYGEASTIWFYEPSTNTKKDVFSDANLSTPINQSSGIAADAAGFWPTIYCSPALYRIIVKDADGITRQDEDNFDPGLAAGFGVTSVVGIAQGGTESTTPAGARQKLDVPSNAAMQTAQDNITTLQTQITPGLNGSNVLGVVAALAEVTPANMGDQVVLRQRVTLTTKSNSTTTTTTPASDTSKPQVGEGTLLFSQVFTPLSATSTLCIRAVLNSTADENRIAIFALFKDSDADAIAATTHSHPADLSNAVTVLEHYVASASTGARTYTIRMGVSGGTLTMDSPSLGGVKLSRLTIEEWDSL